MPRTLSEIHQNFVEVQESANLTQRQKDGWYVQLMNELEYDYHTFRMEPAECDLVKPELILYREISFARSFD